jgi:hypothetical protein
VPLLGQMRDVAYAAKHSADAAAHDTLVEWHILSVPNGTPGTPARTCCGWRRVQHATLPLPARWADVPDAACIGVNQQRRAPRQAYQQPAAA